MLKYVYLLIGLLVTGVTVLFFILSVKKHGIKSIFNKRTFILAPISCICLLINLVFLNRNFFIELNTASGREPIKFLIEINDSEAQVIALVSICISIIIWLILFIINLCKYKFLGVTTTIIQMILFTILFPQIFILIGIGLAIAFVAFLICFFGALISLGETTPTKEPRFYYPKRLIDRYGVDVEHVYDFDGNRYEVDSCKIKDSEGKYVNLRKDADDNYIDEYGKIYH